MGNRRQTDYGRNGQWDGGGWMGGMGPSGEGLSPDAPFLGWLCTLFGPSMSHPCEQLRGRAAARGISPASKSPRPAEALAPCPRPISFLPCCCISSGQPPDHPEGEVPEPVLNQLFLEITPHQEPYFLRQMISFCLPASSLAFLNTTARIDAVLGQCTAVDFCLPGDFTSPSNQARQRLSPGFLLRYWSPAD